MNPIELDSAEFVWLQQRQYEQVEAREQERIAQAHKGLVVVVNSFRNDLETRYYGNELPG